jgi:hypothetical protein
MAKYTVYQGELKCSKCPMDVKSFRHYPNGATLSWACPDKHVTEVSLKTRKNREDFD